MLVSNGCLREAQGVLNRHGGFRDLLENTSNSSQVSDATFFLPHPLYLGNKVLSAKNLSNLRNLEKGSDNYNYVTLYLKQYDFIFNVVVNFLAEVKDAFVSDYKLNYHTMPEHLTKKGIKRAFYYAINRHNTKDYYEECLYNTLSKSLIERFSVVLITERELVRLISAIFDTSIAVLTTQ